MIKIGHKLKNLRLKNHLTQSELGARCDLTKGFISQLESDLTSPSLSTLEDILSCLGTNFTEFWSDMDEEKTVYKKEDVIVAEYEGDYKIYWLVSDAQKNEMEPITVEIAPGGATEEHSAHEGEEFGYVLSGTITLHIGQEKYKVKKGESFYFKARTPHYLSNDAKREASVLWVSSPPTF